MKAIVVYSSKRGSTKQYAEWIHEELYKVCDCELVSYAEIKDVNLYEYDLIVYGGWIRGSGIVDFDNLSKVIDEEMLDRMVVFGVGIANQTAENYAQVWSLNIGKIDPKNEHRTMMYILDGKYNPDTVTGFDGFLMKVVKKVLVSGGSKVASEDTVKMKQRIEQGVDMVKKENINSLVKDCIKLLNK